MERYNTINMSTAIILIAIILYTIGNAIQHSISSTIACIQVYMYIHMFLVLFCLLC